MNIPLPTFLLISKKLEEVRLLPNNEKFNNKEQFYLVLLYICRGSNLRSLSTLTGLSKATISKYIISTAELIVEHFSDSIRFPQNVETWKGILEKFAAKGLIPTIGAMDGKHVEVRAPTNSGSLFHNYKMKKSIVLFALCDADRRFTYVNIGSPGSMSDAQIYNCSALKTDLENCLPKSFDLPSSGIPMLPFICGDGIFALNHNLMKPFALTNLTPDQADYNLKFSATRVLIEHAFGMLNSRFQILHSTIDFDNEKAATLVHVMCILHNILTPISTDYLRLKFHTTNFSYPDAKRQREALMDHLKSII